VGGKGQFAICLVSSSYPQFRVFGSNIHTQLPSYDTGICTTTVYVLLIFLLLFFINLWHNYIQPTSFSILRTRNDFVNYNFQGPFHQFGDKKMVDNVLYFILKLIFLLQICMISVLTSTGYFKNNRYITNFLSSSPNSLNYLIFCHASYDSVYTLQ